MNTEPTQPEGQIPDHALSIMSVNALTERFKDVYTTVEKTVNGIRSYAALLPVNPDEILKLLKLEEDFKKYWAALEATVDTITNCAALAQYNEQQRNTLADLVRDLITLTQTVTSEQDITPTWLTQRDALSAQLHKLTDNAQQFANKTEEETPSP